MSNYNNERLIELEARLAEVETERDIRLAQVETHVQANVRLEARLAEAERNEETLLGMIRHQRDVLRECLPYINESMAGRRPGRSADDIRAAVKALTSDSASVEAKESPCRHCGSDAVFAGMCGVCHISQHTLNCPALIGEPCNCAKVIPADQPDGAA